MKDQLLTVVEAIRQAKAEITTYQNERAKNAPRTLKRLEAILFDPRVSAAMGLLVPAFSEEAPSVVPQDEHDSENV